VRGPLITGKGALKIVQNRRGFTLFEIFLALFILAIAIVPMMNAFAPSLLSSAYEEEQAVLTGRARQTLNRLADLDFPMLDAHRGNPVNLLTLFGSQAEADKESFAYLGNTYTPITAICTTNASGIPVPDCVTDAGDGTSGLLELTVTLGTVRLQTLKAAR